VHQMFNAALLGHLGEAPPALVALRVLATAATRWLSHASRLLIVAALEHCTAVLCMAYLRGEPHRRISSRFAKTLFAEHAAEELAHCSIAFDLWIQGGGASRVARLFTVISIMMAGFAYTCTAVPWILHRRSGRHLTPTLRAIAGFIAKIRVDGKVGSTLGDLFSFARHDYHPNRLIDAAFPAS